MLGAIFTVHAQFGFLMNWSGAQAGEGFEYHLLAIALAAVLVLKGGGRFAFDRVLARGSK
jgi:putative oxidoreductase